LEDPKMSKVIVIYESMLGNTRSVAEKISEGAKLAPGTQVELTTVKHLQIQDLAQYDKILIGSPTHMGQPTRDTRNLVSKLGAVPLKGKTLAFFNCWSVPNCAGVGVRTLETAATQSAPGAHIISPGLSIQVKGTRGPVDASFLQQAREFGTRIAAG
jgi:flavorubredoxin